MDSKIDQWTPNAWILEQTEDVKVKDEFEHAEDTSSTQPVKEFEHPEDTSTSQDESKALSYPHGNNPVGVIGPFLHH